MSSAKDNTRPDQMPGELRVAIVVNHEIPVGLLANTVATLSIGLGAAVPAMGNLDIEDTNGWMFKCSANRAVPVLQADRTALANLLIKTEKRPVGSIVVPFPSAARGIHVFEDYTAWFRSSDMKEEEIDGVALAGPEKWVRSLTGSLKLLRGN